MNDFVWPTDRQLTEDEADAYRKRPPLFNGGSPVEADIRLDGEEDRAALI
ncbi:MAG: hypothetical protein WAM72_20580 [Xanthobacteraceae bacterium]